MDMQANPQMDATISGPKLSRIRHFHSLKLSPSKYLLFTKENYHTQNIHHQKKTVYKSQHITTINSHKTLLAKHSIHI